VVDLPPSAREYRRLGSARADDIAAEVAAARAALLASLADRLLEPFPAIEPLRGDRAAVTDRIVVLPPAPASAWVSDFGPRNAIVSGDGIRGWYFTRVDHDAMQRVMRALDRYRAKVGVGLAGEPFEIIGRITGAPRIVKVDDAVQAGLDIEVVAVTVGDRVFVEASRIVDGESSFAGEDALIEIPHLSAPDGADPLAVLRAWIAAAQVDDRETWSELVASWGFGRHSAGGPLFYPYDPDRRERLEAGWRHWRTWVMERAYGAKPVSVSAVSPIETGLVFAGAPTIESVTIVFEPVTDEPLDPLPGLSGSGSDEMIELQRRDGGPWRVAIG